uniref:KIB1-4 beta-propeller domain-containing protein n=1 Tax=Aegilops tauschii TaxID=37682 RepID=N1R5S6_AEGTA
MASKSSSLRRRPALTPPPRTSTRTRAPASRDWAGRHKTKAKQIAGHALANDVADYLQFRAACAAWRENTDEDGPKKHSVLDQRFHPRRWILLPNGSSTYVADDDSRDRHSMVNLSRGTKIAVDLPLLQGHTVAIGCGGSPGGVLVLVHAETLVVRLLNPLTGQRVDLASVAPVLSGQRMGYRDKDFSRRCKVLGAGFAGDSTVVLHFGWDNKLVSFKIGGGDHWEIISEGDIYCSAFPFRGKVYFADKGREGLMVVDAEATPPNLVLAARWPTKRLKFWFAYMADSSGVLLVLTNKVNYQGGQGQDDDYTVKLALFLLDADAGKLIRVKDLGQRAMFVGDYSGAFVVSAEGNVVPNAIYFHHDLHQKLLVRGLSDGRTRPMTEARAASSTI